MIETRNFGYLCKDSIIVKFVLFVVVVKLISSRVLVTSLG